MTATVTTIIFLWVFINTLLLAAIALYAYSVEDSLNEMRERVRKLEVTKSAPAARPQRFLNPKHQGG